MSWSFVGTATDPNNRTLESIVFFFALEPKALLTMMDDLDVNTIGAAERAMALMIDRVQTRVAFGKPLAEQGVVRESIAKSRNEIDQTRLLCHKAAWTIDQHGNKSKEAQVLVAQIKAVAPQMACDVIDRAIQVHGAMGICDDVPLSRLYAWHRAMRLFDGPDEVHMRTIARAELGKEKSAFAAAVTK